MDAFLSVSPSNKKVLAQIEATKANIRRLTSQIHDLEHSRQNERQTLARLCFMVTPVGKLPTELLVEVFASTVHSYPASRTVVDRDSRPFGPDHPVHQSLRLSHVCSFWREIVLGLPRLWATGLVDVRLDGKNCPKDYLDLLHTLLVRSAPLPISISLTHKTESPNFHAPSTAAILQAVAPTASRWKYCRVDKYSLEAVKESSIPPLTALEELNLRPNVDLQGTPMDLFLGCSRLHRLTINLMEPHNIMLRLPWGQLTHLKLVELDPATCRSILLQCRNLISARLTTSQWNTTADDAPTTRLPFLKSLKLRFEDGDDSDDDDLAPFLTSLCLPALRTLELAFDYETSWPAEEFAAFQARSPKITRISLESCLMTSQQLVAILSRTPSLKTLLLSSCYECVDNEFLQALGGSQRLVPRLREIAWRWIGRHYDPTVFEIAIKSRCSTNGTAPPHVMQLKKMTIGKGAFGGGPPDWLRDLVEHGLELDII